MSRPIEADALIHTASLWLLPGWLEKYHARGVRRVIAFSSTSRFTKQASASPYELEVVNKLIAAEDHLAAECERLGMAWTIFRPTLDLRRRRRGPQRRRHCAADTPLRLFPALRPGQPAAGSR
jgi:hypothetical protein